MDQVGAIPQEVSKQEASEAPGDFSAILTPHRSLSPRGFLIFMVIIAVISFIAGMAFYIAGAWPVLGFFGLDMLLIYGAFKLNYFAARAYETVSISGNTLTVTKVLPSGKSKSWTFNPYWARVELISMPGRASRLLVTSHGRRLVLGAFLTEGERQDFAAALQDALAASKSHSPA